jgi:hypothetical protein
LSAVLDTVPILRFGGADVDPPFLRSSGPRLLAVDVLDRVIPTRLDAFSGRSEPEASLQVGLSHTVLPAATEEITKRKS